MSHRKRCVYLYPFNEESWPYSNWRLIYIFISVFILILLHGHLFVLLFRFKYLQSLTRAPAGCSQRGWGHSDMVLVLPHTRNYSSIM